MNNIFEKNIRDIQLLNINQNNNIDYLLITIHGAFVSNSGESGTDRLIEQAKNFFQKKELQFLGIDFDYGFKDGLFARCDMDDIVSHCFSFIWELVTLISPKFLLILGHSNGCAIMHKLSYFAPFQEFIKSHRSKPEKIDYIYLNPALKPNLAPSEIVSHVHVWHSPHDKAVEMAALVNFFTRGLIFPSIWGKMGNVGYQPINETTHANQAIFNKNIETIYAATFKRELHFNHSTILTMPHSMGEVIFREYWKIENMLLKKNGVC